MKQVPYYGNPNNDWCALACYTMVAQYLLADKNITFEQLKDLAKAQKGYIVWAFPVWNWMMDHRVHIEDHDISDMVAWSKEGVEGLRKGVSAEEFEYYDKHTLNLKEVTKQLTATLDHPSFVYEQVKVSWNMILDTIKKPGICDLTLNGRMLHRVEGFSVHRIVLIDITDKEVIFHDPTVGSDGAYKHEPIEFFRAAVESMSGPEICRYYL